MTPWGVAGATDAPQATLSWPIVTTADRADARPPPEAVTV